MKFRHKSDRIPGLGIFGCSWSFEKVLFILKMKFQNAFCCFQKTQKCSSPLFLRTPFFLKDGLRSVLLFFKDGGGPRGPKKGDASPFFIFFMDCVFRARRIQPHILGLLTTCQYFDPTSTFEYLTKFCVFVNFLRENRGKPEKP